MQPRSPALDGEDGTFDTRAPATFLASGAVSGR